MGVALCLLLAPGRRTGSAGRLAARRARAVLFFVFLYPPVLGKHLAQKGKTTHKFLPSGRDAEDRVGYICQIAMKTTKSYTVDQAQARMERYCSMEDRCHKQVEEKLRQMNMIPQAVDHILYHLITNGYLNEERFARTYARSKFNQKKWGKNRIIRELKMREISKFNIDAALSEIDDNKYHEVFDSLSRKRLPHQRRLVGLHFLNLSPNFQ